MNVDVTGILRDFQIHNSACSKCKKTVLTYVTQYIIYYQSTFYSNERSDMLLDYANNKFL